MSNRTLFRKIFIAVWLLLATACTQGKPTAPPTVTPFVPTAGWVSTATPAPAKVTRFGQLWSALGRLDSYRSHTVYRWEGTAAGQPVKGSLTIDGAYVRQPPAQHVTVTSVENGGEPAVFETIRISDTIWFKVGDRWTQMPADPPVPFGQGPRFEALSPEAILSRLRSAERVQPDLRVNSILCHHYTFDESDLEGDVFSRAEGELWIAKEGGFVVRFRLRGWGGEVIIADGQGTVDISAEVRDVDEEVRIEAPEADVIVPAFDEAEQSAGE